MNRTHTKTKTLTRALTQTLSSCTPCPHTGAPCVPGHALITRLAGIMSALGDALPEAFEMSGHSHETGCGVDCTMAWHCSQKGCVMFGDVGEGVDAAQLLSTSESGMKPPGAVIAMQRNGTRLS